MKTACSSGSFSISEPKGGTLMAWYFGRQGLSEKPQAATSVSDLAPTDAGVPSPLSSAIDKKSTQCA